MPDEFHGDKTLLTFYETSSFSLLATSAKLMIFSVIKLSMKLSLRLALEGLKDINTLFGRASLKLAYKLSRLI